MEFKEGIVGRVAHVVGKMLPEGSFKKMLWLLYARHIKFKSISNSVDQIIEWERFENGLLHIRLKNGLEYYAPPYTSQKSEDRYTLYWETYDSLMEQFIIGIYEKNYQIQKGDIVIDVGASLGFNTVDFSRKVGDEGRIIAIEPHKRSLVILRKNLELNKCRNVTIVGKGVWSKKDNLRFYLKESARDNSLVSTYEGRTKVIGTTEVEVDTLDNILEELGIDEVALIKIDIEGAEIEALKGMGRILSKNGTRVVIASCHRVNGQPAYKTITPAMEAIGFNTKFDSRNGISYFSKLTPVVG